ncbi:HIT family protein [Enterovirga rhinocerotis]|uniref:Histidine triad (HIT) family protein n=1 Tax=Enterovirga rhinocerotis TaxID=1339210 RepID=A0A4R7CC78_9HYPH|nr:HIT domain-containing protein [Enterovirga rhinocerotis]TDR94397.1 histidine triad (HIT) family protein [Enterovirga rhinocerotis]
MTSYDPNNVFAKILRGELPSQTVYEDERTIAIMDIMPRADGHALVIPKAPSRTFLDMAPEDIAAVYRTVQTVARAAKTAFAADGITIQQFNEAAGGQVVFHTHVHVLPRKAGVPLRPHTGEMAAKEVLEAHAAKLKDALAKAG